MNDNLITWNRALDIKKLLEVADACTETQFVPCGAIMLLPDDVPCRSWNVITETNEIMKYFEDRVATPWKTVSVSKAMTNSGYDYRIAIKHKSGKRIELAETVYDNDRYSQTTVQIIVPPTEAS